MFLLDTIYIIDLLMEIKKGGLVHVAPACAVFENGPTILDLMSTTFPCISARGCL
jgi:hypothetical protein